MHIDPTPEQAQAFGAQSERPEPVFMLNLLRFKDRADGIDAGEGISGLEAYQRYAAATASHLQRVGGELLWAGACDPALIGPSDVEWDLAAVVRYPSRAAFLEMIRDPDYLATTAHRSAALADSRLSRAPLLHSSAERAKVTKTPLPPRGRLSETLAARQEPLFTKA